MEASFRNIDPHLNIDPQPQGQSLNTEGNINAHSVTNGASKNVLSLSERVINACDLKSVEFRQFKRDNEGNVSASKVIKFAYDVSGLKSQVSKMKDCCGFIKHQNVALVGLATASSPGGVAHAKAHYFKTQLDKMQNQKEEMRNEHNDLRTERFKLDNNLVKLGEEREAVFGFTQPGEGAILRSGAEIREDIKNNRAESLKIDEKIVKLTEKAESLDKQIAETTKKYDKIIKEMHQ